MSFRFDDDEESLPMESLGGTTNLDWDSSFWDVKRPSKRRWLKPCIVIAVTLVFVVLFLAIVFAVVGITRRDEGASTTEEGGGHTLQSLKALAKPILDSMDRSVNPCDDFYQYACGGWLKNTQLPPDKSSVSRSFSAITDSNLQLLKEIVEDEWPMVSTFYKNCMDNTTRDARGVSDPLESGLQVVEHVTDAKTLALALAYMHLHEMKSAFSFYGGADLDDPSKFISNIDQGGLGLPSKDYYLNPSEQMEDIRKAYKQHVAKMLRFLGGSYATGADQMTDQIVELETRLATASLYPAERREPYAVFHKKSIAEIKSTWTNVPWDDYFERLGLTDPSRLSAINVAVPTFVDALDAEFGRPSAQLVEQWKPYLAFRLIEGSSWLLTSAVETERSEFTRKLYGASKMPPQWKTCVSATEDYLGFVLGHVYVLKRFPADSKEQAKHLIDNLEKAFNKTLDSLSWMDDTTRANARRKLSMITNKVGYPDEWPSYDRLFVEPGRYYETAMVARQLEKQKEISQIGRETDRKEWEMFPQTVNAYYRPDMNEVVFPAGIMQPPFFEHTYLNSMNYGGIGMVIGHELTHGFDDEGRSFDGEGKLRNWWTPETEKRFKEKAACVRQQYSSYTVLDGTHLNGNLTLGENIADNGGLKHAYDAFKAAGEPKLKAHDLVPKAFDGLTNDQLFFVSYAQTWCAKYTDEYLAYLVATNPHSPGKFRVEGPLANSPEFAAAFRCKEGSAMNPKKKCAVW